VLTLKISKYIMVFIITLLTNQVLFIMTKKKIVVVLGLVALIGFATIASASHSWGNYHWGRMANPFTLELGDNVSSKWDAHLSTTASDWSSASSSVLNTVVAAGGTNPRKCRGTNGRVEVCNASYGNNGWLGIAQIWVTGDHITKGVTKVNDTYFDTPAYDTPEWRNLVMCQEVGHTLGLAHQDEDFNNPNLGTCMDYTSDPTSNQHPNQHDYDMLESIYAHLDSVNTVGPAPKDDKPGKGNGKGKKGKSLGVGTNIDLNDPSEWGQEVREDAQGKHSLYERNLGKGKKLFTFVIWVQ
jgi:hypothetical protein